MRRFTFKIDRATGRYASFFADNVDIKIKGKVVGSFSYGIVRGRDRILFHVKDETQKSGFRNIVLKKEVTTINETKQWLNDNFEAITTKFQLHQIEDKP